MSTSVNKWVLIDVSWLSHRARYAMGGLSFNDMATGTIFGFLEQLRSTCLDQRVRSNLAVLCFDSRQSVRKLAFPEYKETRHKDRTPEEWNEIRVMKKQVKLLRREILPDCGFVTLRQTGFESDDLIAQAAKQIDAYPINEQAVMITGDGDLYQCVTDAVHWYDPSRDVYLDPAGIWRKKGVGPDQWADVKCLAGCSTDEVPGIPGVGEKTAAQYLVGLLNPAHKRYAAIACPAGREVAARNRALVALPHPETRAVELRAPEYHPDAFYRWAAKLGFASYLDGPRRRGWDRFFAGDLTDGQQVARKRGESRE